MVDVTVYSKPGCHLCESVEQVIARVRRAREFRLAVRDISENPEDFAKYATEIPVVVVNGREVARYRMSTAEFVAALDAAV